jgi:hypothetical protein
VWNTDLMETMELENLLINAAITMHSAERRKVRRFVWLYKCWVALLSLFGSALSGCTADGGKRMVWPSPFTTLS